MGGSARRVIGFHPLEETNLKGVRYMILVAGWYYDDRAPKSIQAHVDLSCFDSSQVMSSKDPESSTRNR